MTDAEVREAARVAVGAVQRMDFQAATEFITPERTAWDAYRLFREAARMAAQPGIVAVGSASPFGVWVPDIAEDETPEQVFGLRFVAAVMNGDTVMAEGLFEAEWVSMDDADPEGRRFARSYAAVLALAAVYGERVA